MFQLFLIRNCMDFAGPLSREQVLLQTMPVLESLVVFFIMKMVNVTDYKNYK